MARKLDKDLKKLTRLEEGVRSRGQNAAKLGFGLLFLALAGLLANLYVGFDPVWAVVVVAAVVAAYMALNIGANDVANNMSPAVGSRTLTIGTAVAIAAICEAAGAIVAGGEVVATVSSGIVRPQHMPDAAHFTTAMIAALFAAALWINLATWVGAPVSTTHSVVGGVLGAGIAMAGLAAADWAVVLRILASWVVSPVLGGVIAAAFLAFIKQAVFDAPDRIAAARSKVPVLVGIMAGAFVTYLLLKGLSKVTHVPLWAAVTAGLATAAIAIVLVRPLVGRHLERHGHHASSVRSLFSIPVIGGACLLSFAHGSNDVANAIGPLAAIYQAAAGGELGGKAPVPFWVLLIGAGGIALGLLLYGPHLIRTVGHKITKLNRVRAFCITLSAALTVIVASAMGLPVSSTHIAIGALFGVGFFREYLANREKDARPRRKVKAEPLPQFPAPPGENPFARAERMRRRYLVRRSHLLTIVAAWIVTVPISGAIAAGLALLIAATGLVTAP